MIAGWNSQKFVVNVEALLKKQLIFFLDQLPWIIVTKLEYVAPLI